MKIRVSAIIALFLGLSFVLMPSSTTKSVEPFIKMFEKDMKTKINTVITLGNRKGNIVGTCYLGLNRVIIDFQYWNTAPDLKKKSVIYHEIGHCQYGLMHDDSMMSNNSFCPKSLMHPKTIDWFCLQTNWDYYVDEMRRRIKGR